MLVELEYEPRDKQIEIHTSLKRFNVLVCHRRFGKTVLCINQLIKDALKNTDPRPRYAYIAPLYKQAKSIAWDYLKHYTSPIPGVKFNEAELRVDLPNGARISLYGADNYDALRGIYLDGVVLDEFAQMSPKAWSEVIRPALSDRKGWAIFIGTPMGRNTFYDLYQYAQTADDWYGGMFKASDTNHVDKDELEAAKMHMTPDEYNQEFECSFDAAIRGAYYANDITQLRENNRICKLDPERNLKIHTAWDLGINDAMSVWCIQTWSKEIRLIKYIEGQGEGILYYLNMLETLYPKQLGTFYFPHDIKVRELGTGRSRLEVAQEWGVRDYTIAKKLEIADGINAVRMLFNRFYIDEREEHGINCITQYRKDWDEKNQVFKPKPLHDWSSHCADALRTFAVGFDDYSPQKAYNQREAPKGPYEI